MYRFGILGLGKMGTAILNGVIKKEVFKHSEIMIYTPNIEKQNTCKNIGFSIAKNEYNLFESCETILIAIKPQKFSEVLINSNGLDFTDKCVISIAAGKTIEDVEQYFKNATIVRVMPNTPAVIASASSTLCYNKYNDLSKKAKEIFESIGVVEIIEECQMNESLPLNGSMPAYLYLFAKTFIENGVKYGIDYETSKKLCCNSIIGSCKMILESKDNIDVLIDNVCSKGGTTIAGLNELYKNNFVQSLDKCYSACVNRAIELKKES
ncbi:MAG: pyrroline-5-carboxylate reductase [Anaeroplasma sp.]